MEAQQCLRTAARWLTDIETMMVAKMQETKRRDPTTRTTAKSRPCRMTDQGCKESHGLDRCGIFRSMSAERKLAVLQKEQICLGCYKHWNGRKCFARADRGYQSCGVNGCEDHHAEELHWVVVTKSLFSELVQPAAAQQRPPKKRRRARHRWLPQNRAASAATEADPTPMAAQKEPSRGEEVPEEKGAAPAVEEDLPPAATPEEDEAAPAGTDGGLPPTAAPEDEEEAVGAAPTPKEVRAHAPRVWVPRREGGRGLPSWAA